MTIFTGNLELHVNQGELISSNIMVKEQRGGVIQGTVLFKNGKPVNNAVVVLNYKCRSTGKVNPLTFTFTDINGMFIFGIKNNSCDYIINISYSELI